MTAKDALQFCTRDTDLALPDKEATYCYGMSKMTVRDENLALKDGRAPHDRLEFVEFLEMLGRIADAKFAHTNMDDTPLA